MFCLTRGVAEAGVYFPLVSRVTELDPSVAGNPRIASRGTRNRASVPFL